MLVSSSHEPTSDDRSARIDDAELERVAALGWPGLEQERLGDWVLRASGGFTGRGNSVLPMGDPGRPLGDAVDAVVAWYRRRALPPTAQVPLPLCSGVDDELDRRGWRAFNRTHILTGAVALLLDSSGSALVGPVRLEPYPSAAWLGGYHYRGAELPAGAADVLALGADPVFASIEERGEVVAVGRGIVDEGWLGVTAVTVGKDHRRRGLGSAIMAGLATWGAEQGAHSAYLQVAVENTAALQMYGRLGMRRHHDYQYRRLDSS